MKNVIKMLWLLLISIVVIATFSGCDDKKDDNTKDNVKEEVSITIEDELEEYLNNVTIINNKEVEEFCNTKQFKLVENDVNGVISGTIINIDNKDNKKALIVEKKDDSLVLQLFNKGEKELEKITEVEISNRMNMDILKINGFAKYVDDSEYKVCIEVYSEAGMFADGVTYEFIPIIITDDEMYEKQSYQVSGSAMDEGEIQEYINFVKKQGFKISTINKSIVEQDKDIVQIFNITRKHLKDFDPLEVYETKSEKMKYGTTIYKDLSSERKGESVSKDNSTEESTTEKKSSSVDLYKKVLNNELEFIDQTSENVYFKEYIKSYDVQGYETKCSYAILDMDQDKDDEMVVKISGFDVMYLILKNQDGTIYGYEQSARGLMGLKTDGTYIGSGGATVYGICSSTFTGTKMNTKELAFMDGDECVINGESVTVQQFQNYRAQFDLKKDVEFVDFN